MTYFMRFLYATGEPFTLLSLEDFLNRQDGNFAIFVDSADEKSGDLMYGEDVYGVIEVNSADEDLFREEIQELREIIADMDEVNVTAVRDFLDKVTGMIAIEVSEFGHYHEDKLDPLWDWIFSQRGGLLQVDEEGYYDRERLILPVSGEEDI